MSEEVDAATPTPPGKKILKIMEASRGNKFYMLKAKMSDAKPRLIGHSGDFIDLDCEKKTTTTTSVDRMWQRFGKSKNDSEPVSVDSKNGGKNGCDVPGAKLRVLKDELEPKMRQLRKDALTKRFEIWKSEQKNVDRKSGDKKNRRDESEDDDEEDQNSFSRDNIDDGESDRQNVVGDSLNGNGNSNTGRDFEEAVDELRNGIEDDTSSLSSDLIGEDSVDFQDGVSDEEKDVRCVNDAVGQPIKAVDTSVSASKSLSRFGERSKSEDGFCVSGGLNENESSSVRLHLSPDNSRVDSVNTIGNDSVAKARKLLARVISVGDSQPPTSQDILSACSGQFLNLERSNTASHLGGDSMTVEPKTNCSTPASNKAPKLYCGLFNSTPMRPSNRFTGEESRITTCDSALSEPEPEKDELERRSPTDSSPLEDQNEETVYKYVRKNRNRLLSESESEEEIDNDEDDSDDDEGESFGEEENGMNEPGKDEELDEEEAYLRRERKRRQEFFDEEAELSGSDHGGDDNEDGLDNDELEPEAGDLDELPDEDILRSQIGRVHWKQQMDEDKRQLLRYKEAYLRDGEEEIGYRFRWRRAGADEDDDFGGDECANDGDNATQDVDELDEEYQESLRQRAKWLNKHGVAVEDALADVEEAGGDSQFFNSAKAALSRVSSTIEECMQPPCVAFQAHGSTLLHHSVSVDSGATSLFFRRESLLNRGNSVLEKLSTDSGDGVATSRNKAVFTMLSPPKKEAVDEERGEKRAIVNETMATAIKKRKLFKDTQSIFEIFN